MRFLKPILVAVATVGVVAAGAASSFGAVSGPTATNLSSTSGVPQLSNSGAVGHPAPGMAAPNSADSQQLAKVPALASGVAGTLTRQNAIDAALAKTAGATVVGAQRAYDHTAMIWKVRLNSNGSTVDYQVDASTGAVTLQSPVAGLTKNSDTSHR